MLIIQIPNINISFETINSLLYGCSCNNCYIEVALTDYNQKILTSNLLYVLTLKATACQLNQKNLAYIVDQIIINLQEYSKRYNIDKLTFKELNKDVFCYELSNQYKTFRLCCQTNVL